MKNISYIGAGAGSGKTYKLTHLLAELIADEQNPVQPEQVILTTFTKDAAAELKERGKTVLFEKGKPEEALRLDRALIGTVHSVAESFIRKYWYLLGISPDVDVISEDDQTFYINQSLANLATQEDLDFFAAFCDEFNISKSENNISKKDEFFWKEDLKHIIEKSQCFGITEYGKSREESKAWLKQFVEPIASFPTDDASWAPVIAELKAAVDNGLVSPTAKKTVDPIIYGAKNRIFSWYNKFIKYFADSKTPKKVKEACPQAMDMLDRLNNIYSSEWLCERQEAYIDRIFDLAEKWGTEFLKYKQEHQLIDFNDMEAYLLKLLEIEEVRTDIQQSFKYLLVDEFQDSSRAQVQIFSTLSDLVEKTYFVGDEKQAIYAFRGGNPELIAAVTKYIEQGKNGCEKLPSLDTSRRSVPEIVHVVNHVFLPLFQGHGMKEEDIVLKDNDPTEYGDRTLNHWVYDGNNDDSYHALAQRLVRMIKEEKLTNLKEIAILGGSNANLNKLTDVLKSYGIPVNRGSGLLMDCKETDLLFAVLSIIENPHDLLSKTEIAYLTEEGWTLNKIVDAQLAYRHEQKENENAVSPFDEVGLVKAIQALSADVKNLSVGTMVEDVVVKLRLNDVVKRMGNAPQRIANLQSLCNYAWEYEERCVKMGQAATIDGYMRYVEQMECQADGDPEGVVVDTYHGSKGLGWKTVILTSLDTDRTKEDELIRWSIYGVQMRYLEAPSVENFYPEGVITVLPWFMGSAKILPPTYKSKITASNVFNSVKNQVVQERTRLMYVGMTRAKKRLVLFEKKQKNPLAWFKGIGVNVGDPYYCLGTEDRFVYEELPKDDDPEVMPEPAAEQTIYEEGAEERLPRNIRPSANHNLLGEVSVIKGSQSITRLACEDKVQSETAIGDCIHQIYCDIDCDDPVQMAREVIRQRLLVGELPDPAGIIKAYQHLELLLAEKYGEAIAKHREMSFKHFVNGQVVNGSIDLAWETAEGIVLIDYKTFHGKANFVLDKEHPSVYAGRYKMQLDYYTAALEAAGHKVLAKLIYYPVTGMLVKVE